MVQRISILITSISLVALQAFAGAGQAGFDFLRRDLSAASVAIASANTAYPQPTSFDGNPASLANKTGRTISVGYIDYPLDLSAGHIAYAQPWRGFTVGGRLAYFNYGSFDKTSVAGEKLGTFGANDIYVAGLIAKQTKYFSTGAELGYLSSKIDTYSASAIVFSGGISAPVPIMSQLQAGVDIRNLGINVKKFDESTTDLPTSMRIGFSKRLDHLPLTLLAQLSKWSDTDPYFAGAGEFDVSDPFKLRMGYSTLGADQKTGATSESIAGFSAGFGLKYRDYLFDFAYAFQGALGDRLYVQFNWFPVTAASSPR
ncbi:MAG: PorV/PorQ family protein [bacterium]|nr:PorV/PorQ family protein [bacterium]